MYWVIGGFVMVVFIELMIRVLSDYKPEKVDRRRR